MKTRTWPFAVFFLLTPFAAHTAEIKYSFETLTTPRLISMNDKNERAATILTNPNGSFEALYTDAQGQDVPFECGLINPASLGDTQPSKINGKGEISGSCVSGDFNTRTIVSFIREPTHGHLTFVQVPGANGTNVWGLNTRGQAVGQYYNPVDFNRSGFFRFHGFVWDGTHVTTVDVPVVNSVTTFFGIDDAGRILGQYFVFDPMTNETSTSLSFIYDNGQFTLLQFPGAKFTDAQDINKLGQIAGNTDLGIFFYDDGQYYTIPPPDGFVISSVDNIDDDGRLLGWYKKTSGCPFPGCPTQRFLATQVVVMPPTAPPQAQAKKNIKGAFDTISNKTKPQ